MNEFPELEAAFPLEVLQELQVALAEVGDIQPWYDDAVACWVFVHPLYPDIEAAGESAMECVARYRGWLAQFIQERLKGNITPQVEKLTTGRGGVRPGAGRPKGSPTVTIRLPKDIAGWLRDPGHLEQVRRLMQA